MPAEPTLNSPGNYRYVAISAAVAAFAVGVASLVGSQLPPMLGLTLTPVVSGLEEPVAAALQPGTGRIFINERTGRVRVLEDGELLDRVAIDLSERLVTRWVDEGLLGIAFHPEFPGDPRTFLAYTESDTLALVVSSFRVSEDGYVFDPASEVEVLRVPSPYGSHPGGTVRFGPDGMLWITLGDGGWVPDTFPNPESQDPLRLAQDLFTLNGKLVRVDVAVDPYSIPADNPFADGTAARPEVWAYGLRNPWSLWFYRDLVIVGDVGHSGWEEINTLHASRDGGSNLGWSEWEGSSCFADRGCHTTAPHAKEPWMTISHDDTCAAIVGPVYRGTAMPELAGEIPVADHCGQWIRSARIGGAGDEWIDRIADLTFQPTAWFEGADRELYLFSFEGTLYRLDPVRR